MARTVTVTGLGDMKAIEDAFRNAGLVVKETADSMADSSRKAGTAAAEMAKQSGASADEQAAAAGRAAAAFVAAQDEMSRAQKAAGAAAADAAKRAGLSADEQEAAYARAAEAAGVSGSRIDKAFDESTTKAGNALSRLGKMGESWGIPLSGSLTKMGEQFDKAETKSQKLSGALADLGKVTLLAGGAGVAVVGYEAVKLGDQFETAQAKIQGATGVGERSAAALTHAFGATAGEFMDSGQKMEAAYAEVAGQLKATEGHALAAGEAMQFTTAAERLNEATAGQLTATTGALSQTMMAFHLGASQAASTSDTLFNASKALDVPLTSVATSASRLHSRLGELAPSFGDIAGLMVALGTHGVQGSRGLQVVNTAMQTLVGGSKKTDEVLQALGVRVFDQNGKFIGLQNVIGQLQPKLAGLTQQQQLFAEQTLFGKGAAQIMGQVIQDGVPAFQKATDAATKMGTAQRAAAEQQHTLHGETEQLKSAVETLGGDLGVALIPKLQVVAHDTAEVVVWMEKHKAVAEALGITIGSVLGVAVAVYAEQKLVAFGHATAAAAGDMVKMAGAVKDGAERIIASFAAEDEAAQASAAKIEAASSESSAAVEAEQSKMQMSFGEIDSGFVGTATAATTAEGEIATQTAAMAEAVQGADTEIEAANAAAGASFTAMLGPIAAVVAALTAAQPIIKELTGGDLGENAASERSFLEKSNKSGHLVSTPKGGFTQSSFAKALLAGVGAPTSGSALKAVEAWVAQEGGNWHNSAKYNPLNTTYGMPGAGNTGSQGNIKSYTSWRQGLEATLDTIKEPQYAKIIGLLQQGASVSTIETAINESKWGTHFPNPSAASHAATHGGSNVALQGLMNETATGKKTAAALGVPVGVVTMLSTAQALLGTRYTSGGGHAGWDPIEALKKIGVDCSGFVSQILHRGGVPLSNPLTTEGFPSALARGQGRYVTVYDRANAGGNSHALIDILGHYYESGGNPKYNPSGGVAALTKAQAQGELSAGGFVAYHPTGQLNAPEKGRKGITESLVLKMSGAAQTLEAASFLEKEIKGLETKGTAKLRVFESDIQTGSVKPLEKLTGYSEQHKRGHESESYKEFIELVNSLKSVHEKALTQLADKLVSEHAQALRTLDAELYAGQEKADARKLNLQAVELKDQTKISEAMSAKVVEGWKDATNVMVAGIDTATTALKDAGQSISDSLSAEATAIRDQTQAMTDAAAAAVQQIQDKSQTEVDILGERGLYGLNLVAQQQQVQLDQMKTGYDAQTALAQQAIDKAQSETDNATAATTAMVDAVTAQQDALVGQAKTAVASTEQGQNAAVQAAQQNLDSVTKRTDQAVQEAENASQKVATGTQSQQQVAQAAVEHAKAEQAKQVAQAEASLEAAKAASSAAVQQAQNALATAEANAGKAEQEAQNAVANAKGHAEVVLAEAQKILAEAQDRANVAEAEQQALVEKTKAEAQTQYAGSGLIVNIEGIPSNDAAAIASEVSWVLKTQVPA